MEMEIGAHFFGLPQVAFWVLKGKSVNNEEKHRRLAVYPGSFDPLTNGHLDIARRAAGLFDTLIIAVYAFPAKNLLFSVEERIQLWQEVLAAEELTNVQVDKFTNLLVEYVRSVGGQAIIKGLRSPNDFEAEFQQGLMSRKPGRERERYASSSSSTGVAKEIRVVVR